MKPALIVAMTRARLIGRDGDLPWHHSEDLKHFKAMTRGHTVVMGRGCMDSLGKPLPKRTNLVVSRTLGADAGADGVDHEGFRVFGDLPAACAWAERNTPDDPETLWVLGGSTVYEAFLAPLEDGARAFERAGLPRTDRLVITWVPEQPLQPGDVLFPYDEAWIMKHFELSESWAGETAGLQFCDYRVRAPGGA
ncbi:MAG: dihydrofolate reductase [Planctomycetota bacterium]|nr:MAG: dihydrofolate reductase [Planctomycetota bacterium]